MLLQPEQEDDEAYTYSDEVRRAIESWDEDRQKRFCKGLQRWYGWVYPLLC